MLRKATAPLVGSVSLPGDKSVTHRALLISALASGTSTVSGANLGDDVRASCRALTHLGPEVRIEESGRRITVEAGGWRGLREPETILDLENSGTGARTLAGICAGVHGLSVLTGDASLRRRPMLRVVAPLRQMGARIEGRAHGDRLPLAIRGGDLQGIDLQISVASAQVKTALLLAGLNASGPTFVTEPAPSRDHTERMLVAAGVPVEKSGSRIGVPGGGSQPQTRDWTVPGDLSSAMFLVVAALLLPGSDLILEEVGLNPTRAGALEVLARMGADITRGEVTERDGEPVGSLRVRASELRGTRVGPDEIPSLIDEIPILALAASQAEGETRFAGVGELRVKESDRIEGITSVLRSLGAEVEPGAEELTVKGPLPLRGGEIDAAGDHRLAMTAAVAGLLTPEKVKVLGWSVVSTSFPGFADVLAGARGKPRKALR